MFRKFPESKTFIHAIAIIVVAVFILDSIELYYYLERLISELEWTALLAFLAWKYRTSGQVNRFTNAVLVGLLCIQLWCLIDAIWIAILYARFSGLPLDQAENIIYDGTHTIHISGYLMILGGFICGLIGFVAEWFTKNLHGKK